MVPRHTDMSLGPLSAVRSTCTDEGREVRHVFVLGSHRFVTGHSSYLHCYWHVTVTETGMAATRATPSLLHQDTLESICIYLCWGPLPRDHAPLLPMLRQVCAGLACRRTHPRRHRICTSNSIEDPRPPSDIFRPRRAWHISFFFLGPKSRCEVTPMEYTAYLNTTTPV